MSSLIDQNKEFSDSVTPEKNVHCETSSLKITESSASQSSTTLLESPEVDTAPRSDGECRTKNILTEPGMQASSRQETGDIQGHEDEASDSAHLLDSHSSLSNGEGCFENENVFETNDESSVNGEHQSRVQVEVGSTWRCRNKEENPRRSEDYENDSQNAVESRTSDVRTQPEILLQPLSLRCESSRTQSSSREKLGANFPLSVHYTKPTGTSQNSSPPAKRRREDLGADPSSGVRFIKPTGTRQHPTPTTEHGRGELGANIPSSTRFIKPTGTREHSSPTAEHGGKQLGADPPWSVRFMKPSISRQHPSPASRCGRENRYIFETGGEQSRNTSAGVSCGGEEIEHLPGESPEPQIVISPSSSSDEPRVNWCKMAKAFVCRWGRLVMGRTCRQFAKAPIFYILSTSVIFFGINAWDREWLDRDLSVAIIGSCGAFIATTLIFDRGQFSPIIGEGNSCIVECRRGCGNADPCIPCCCCRSPEPRVERHSQYRHLEEDGAFEHEIADVSSLDPKDCPQMKMVEQRESEHAESPDYPPEVSQVDADVHVRKQDGEKLGATRKHLGRAARTTKPYKTRSERSRASKTFSRGGIHDPDQVMNDPPELSPIRETVLEDITQHGGGLPANNDEAGTHTTGTGTMSKYLEDASAGKDLGTDEPSKVTSNSPRFPGGGFKKFADCSPTLSRFANTRQSGTSTDPFRAGGERSSSPEDGSFYEDVTEAPEAENFMCEHFGQSVACSCATLLAKAEENIRR